MLLCLNANAASSPLLTPGTFLQTGNVCAGPDDDDDDKERDCHIDVCDKVCVCVYYIVLHLQGSAIQIGDFVEQRIR